VGTRWSWLLLVLGVAACCAVAYAAYTLAGYSWAQVVDYRSPYVVEPLTETQIPPSDPLTRRVVLVIVDGLRDDVSRSGMPNLDRLRGYGADIVVTTAEPSLSYPNWTTILSGAPQTISGVTTNWWEGPVPVPTVVDVAKTAGRRVAVVGPTDFAELYDIEAGAQVSLRDWPKSGYLSGTLIDDALRITEQSDPQLLVLHLPDLDEAGHDAGGDSDHYRQVAAKIDADLARLISGLQTDDTTFVIVADHGHIGAGGHGGWESEVVRVPLVVSGAAAKLGTASGSQDQVASTVAVLLGLRPPAFAAGAPLASALSTYTPAVRAAADAQHAAFLTREIEVVSGDPPIAKLFAPTLDEQATAAIEARRTAERSARSTLSLEMLAAIVSIMGLIAFASWRAFVAALAGTAAYYAVYNLLFFVVHGYLWSLSSFNTESHLQAFFNLRMVEAALSGLVAVAVAAAVYPMSRANPKGPRAHGFLGGWLALAPATVLVIQMTLAVQVAWFLWAYGADVVWTLPDFKWGFKYDLDLIQMTALAAVAIVGPLVSYLVGRYHPRIRSIKVGE